MKMTLLEITQDIMSDMDSDVVNSIDDTDESRQVAQIVKTTFGAMIDSRNWAYHKRGIQLTASGTTDRPTHMTIEGEITEVIFLNYNKIRTGETRNRYEPVIWLHPDEFLRKINPLNNDADNIDVIVDPSGISLNIYNDRAPTHYTSFDDRVIVFNSYDNLVDTTLQSSKVQAQGQVVPVWVHTDTAIPDLPENAFTALLEKAKSRAQLKLAQKEDVLSETEARKQQTWLSRKAFRAQGGVRYRDYGRKGKWARNPFIDKHNVSPTGD